MLDQARSLFSKVGSFPRPVIESFFTTFLNRAVISKIKMARLGFSNSYAAACFAPTSVELHWTRGPLKDTLPIELPRRGVIASVSSNTICSG